MILNYRQQCDLRRIEACLRRSDPHLGAMLRIFGRLYPHQDMPAWEQQPEVLSNQDRIRRAASIVAALAAIVAGIEVLLGKAANVAIAGRHGRAQATGAKPKLPTRAGIRRPAGC